MSADFYLYTEARKGGNSYFYLKFTDKTTGKIKKVSTGILDDGSRKARKTAEATAENIFSQADIIQPPKELTFKDFTADFWDWDRCQYIAARIAREPDALGRPHAQEMRRHLTQRAWKVLGDMPLAKILPTDIDQMTTDLLRAGIPTQTVKHTLASIRTPFAEARRQRLIPFNPMLEILGFSVKSKKRGAFSPDEARKLLDVSTIQTVWAPKDAQFCSYSKRAYSPWKHWAISMLGACMGRRVNEILALRVEDIDWQTSTVHVRRSIDKGGLVKAGTKTGSGSIIPVAPEILELIQPVISPDGFLFQGYTPGRPMNSKAVTIELQKAMDHVGIKRPEQIERLLGFHSWRHFFNTRARAAGLSNAVVQAITEHRTIEMTDHYTQFEANDLKGIMDVQRAVLG